LPFENHRYDISHPLTQHSKIVGERRNREIYHDNRKLGRKIGKLTIKSKALAALYVALSHQSGEYVRNFLEMQGFFVTVRAGTAPFFKVQNFFICNEYY